MSVREIEDTGITFENINRLGPAVKKIVITKEAYKKLKADVEAVNGKPVDSIELYLGPDSKSKVEIVPEVE